MSVLLFVSGCAGFAGFFGSGTGSSGLRANPHMDVRLLPYCAAASLHAVLAWFTD